MANANIRNFVFGVFLLVVLVVTGTYAFSILEGMDLFESFYNIVLIITTVGTSHQISTFYGKLLVVFLLTFGLGLVLYMAVFVAGSIIEGQIRTFLGGLRGGLKMKKNKDHTIVCGYGRLGKYVCETLKEKKQKYIVIEKDSERASAAASSGEPVLQGDGLDPEVLTKAGIKNAKGLIGAMGEDSENIYLIMTATDLNPKLHLAAKAEDEHAVDRLHKVGAKIVVLPQVVGGRQLADAFLDIDDTEELETVSKKK
jgi:voltage-gated potassium channel